MNANGGGASAAAASDEPAARPLLKMSELAERSGVSAGTIRYYLREGLLGDGRDIVRTSRNMAYYPPQYVQRIELIKRLQEERFMPLRVIKGALREDPERVHALIELEDRILERALANAEERSRVSMKAVRERYEIPRNVLERLAEIGVLTPNRAGYDQDDVKIIEAIASFRAGGYDEALGFTVYDTLRYREALEPLVEREVRALLDRLAGEVEVERAMEIIAAGVEPLRELIGAVHSKLLLAELRRQRARSERALSYQSARWCSITPRPRASAIPPGSVPEKVPNGAGSRCSRSAGSPAAALGLGEEVQLRAVLAADPREVGREADGRRLVGLAGHPHRALAAARRVVDAGDEVPRERDAVGALAHAGAPAPLGAGARGSRRCRRSPPAPRMLLRRSAVERERAARGAARLLARPHLARARAGRAPRCPASSLRQQIEGHVASCTRTRPIAVATRGRCGPCTSSTAPRRESRRVRSRSAAVAARGAAPRRTAWPDRPGRAPRRPSAPRRRRPRSASA